MLSYLTYVPTKYSHPAYSLEALFEKSTTYVCSAVFEVTSLTSVDWFQQKSPVPVQLDLETNTKYQTL